MGKYQGCHFILLKEDYCKDNLIVKSIRKLFKNFNENIFLFSQTNKSNGIEVCPSKNGQNFYIRNGNKRLIAYAMKLLNREIKFKPIKISDWRNVYTREDVMNLKHQDTIKGEIL
ncbi:unnamed protein product [marine sediment metagenome]|uniref:Uncharacterized protein n=1 Tax=marine sediment metagenome TaxID=412755 RepID=X1C4N6_9ZZZZ